MREVKWGGQPRTHRGGREEEESWLQETSNTKIRACWDKLSCLQRGMRGGGKAVGASCSVLALFSKKRLSQNIFFFFLFACLICIEMRTLII